MTLCQRLCLALAAVALLAPVAEAGTLGPFFADNPRFEVLPAPYFEPETAAESYLDVEVRPYSFVPAGRRWFVEVEAGETKRFPAAGGSTAKRFASFLALGDRAVSAAAIKLYYLDRNGLARQAVRLALPTVRPERFNAIYQRGPRARQLSTTWGEDGAWLVLIQMRHPASFWRAPEPYLYIGGDFLYQRVEGLVRFLRVHGVNALGYKPDYDRELPLAGMAAADYPVIRRFLDSAAPGRPAQLMGICIGGIHARGLAHRDQGAQPPLVAGVTAIGCPHQGSLLADVYNAQPILPWLHRFLTGDPDIHEYKDSRAAIAAFNQAMPTPATLAHRNVVLDPQGERLDPRYDQMAWALQQLTAAERGVAPAAIRTDGLLTLEEQVYGEPYQVWRTDHAGMINDGRGSTYFDAYQAHLRLIEALHAQRPR